MCCRCSCCCFLLGLSPICCCFLLSPNPCRPCCCRNLYHRTPNINRLAVPTLAEGLHVVVKPCDLRRSLLFKEIAILAVPRSPCLQNILLMTVQASSMPPRRPWPSRRRYCPGPRRAAIISGPTGGRRCPRYGALLKRGLGVRSSWPRSGSFSGLPRPDVARELPFKKPFQRRGYAPHGRHVLSSRHGFKQSKQSTAAPPQVPQGPRLDLFACLLKLAKWLRTHAAQRPLS